MEQYIQIIINTLQNYVTSNHFLIAIIIGIFSIILESIIPALPLALFIATNMLVFGNTFGFFLSWISTIIGCTLSFYLFRFLSKKIKWKNRKGIQMKDRIKEVPFSTLVIILSIPFTPAFSINIAAGLSGMPYQKYFIALCISKLFLIYFWGFMGTTFVQSITDIGVILKLLGMACFAFLLSKGLMQKLKWS